MPIPFLPRNGFRGPTWMTLLPTEPAALPDPLRMQAMLRPGTRYRALTGVLPDELVVVFDCDLRVLSLEGGAVARLPMPASAVVGRYLDEFLSAEQLPRVELHLRAAMRGEGASFDFEGSNGLTWTVQMVPVVAADGRPGGGVARFRDVTEQRAAERALAAHARDRIELPAVERS